MSSPVVVEGAVVPVTGAATVEARKTNIQASFIVLIRSAESYLRGLGTYDRVEALGAVLTVYSLGGGGLFEVC